MCKLCLPRNMQWRLDKLNMLNYSNEKDRLRKSNQFIYSSRIKYLY